MALGDNRVGPQTDADGDPIPTRLTRTGCTVVGDGHGHFREASYRGNSYIAATAISIDTGAGAVAPGTAFGTTATFVLWNPPGSGVNADLWKTTMTWLAGATGNTTVMGAGFIAYGQSPQIVTPGGTAIVPVCCLLGNASAGKIKPFTSGTITTTPTLVRPSGMVIPAVQAAATATASSGWQWVDLIDGELVLTPGNVFVMHGIAAAGTTPLVGLSATWEETPI